METVNLNKKMGNSKYLDLFSIILKEMKSKVLNKEININNDDILTINDFEQKQLKCMSLFIEEHIHDDLFDRSDEFKFLK